MSDIDLDSARPIFIAECRELLASMESALLRLPQEADKDRRDSVHGIFRAAHTIKGSAGIFGMEDIVSFAHAMESVLDHVRDGVLPIGDDLIALLLACADHLGQLVDSVAENQAQPDAELVHDARPLLAQLNQRLLAVRMQRSPGAGDAPQRKAPAAPRQTGADHWHISLRFGRDVLRFGMDPLSFLNYLQRLGRITTLVTLHGDVPLLDGLDPEACYLGFEVALESSAPLSAIEGTFKFVMDDCEVGILPPGSPVADHLTLMRERARGDPAELQRLRAIWLHCASVAPEALDEIAAAATKPAPAQPVPAPAAQPAAAPAPAPATVRARRTGPRPGEASTVRVDADKLDRLVDLVGELITASASATMAGRGLRSAALQEAHEALALLVQEVRDSALQLRMVKIGATFNRFHRVVYDAARDLGKDIALEISGEDTELDKSLVEKIADPLTHLVRNAMDHGIEPPALRLAAGKPAQGTIRLNAYHHSGSIVIEISDDGAGLSRERIIGRARSQRLLDPGREPSEAEVFALIFEPGFSTADAITSLSGRGVGMDVVKRNITALRGSVSLASRSGQGTTVTVRLPLTLAIINCFLIGVGGSVFVLPMDVVEECIDFIDPGANDYTELRGQVLPFIRLRRLFGVQDTPPRRQSLVVVGHGSQRFGLVVDRLLGETQTVIKPLARLFAHLRGISGSSILGSGEVALILDVAALADITRAAMVSRSPAAAAAEPVHQG
ncbi:chemotaxis protein CheA [Amphibiibacter pelophylacis]|uniref:Chemotaxis protein CheA n=1 Tax=Amphibiibacter pelophylacis TaxID=1799477 RepID=A0ACC6P2J4_9BURK